MEELITEVDGVRFVFHSVLCDVMGFNDDELDYFLMNHDINSSSRYTLLQVDEILGLQEIYDSIRSISVEFKFEPAKIHLRSFLGKIYVDLYSLFPIGESGFKLIPVPFLFAEINMLDISTCFKEKGVLWASSFMLDAAAGFREHMEYIDKLKNPQRIIVPKESPSDSIRTYLMKDAITGYVKIGKSKNPVMREKTLQAQIPQISLFAVCEDNIESLLRKKFTKLRLRGEWFNLSSADIQHIIDTYNFKS